MKLGTRNLYLVLHHQLNDDTHRVTFADSIPEALDTWGVSSRISPVWLTSSQSHDPAVGRNFKGDCRLTFLGPIAPAEIIRELQRLDKACTHDVFVTVGCFNVVVHTNNDPVGDLIADGLLAWARVNTVAYEQWAIQNGLIKERTYSLLSIDRATEKVRELTACSRDGFPNHLSAVVQELQATAATSLLRAAAIHGPTFAYIADVVDGIIATVELFKAGTVNAFSLQTLLQQRNAALSRFASQATAGIPPVFEMESHFWPHSLLGIGTATLAVRQLVTFVQRVVGESQLPQRIQLLSDQADDLPDFNALVRGQELLDFDILKQTTLAEPEADPVIPLVSFFSGRDGYSSKLQTLSLPFTALTESNSYRSNLLTITHEISHVIIQQGVLPKISPTPGRKDAEWVSRLLHDNGSARNLLECARKLFLEATLSMEWTETKTTKGHESGAMTKKFHDILRAYRQETQEILVHTFDFIYFYRSDTEYYVRSIWLSWCAIPGIEDRVQEYLLRTLSAISANLLHVSSEKRFRAALAILKPLLEALSLSIDYPVNYVQIALDRISLMESDSEVWDDYDKLYGHRMLLVRLVKVFLHSETLEKKLYAEAVQPREFLSLDGPPIGNVLQFFATYLKDDVSEVESTWLFNILAFDPFAAVEGCVATP
jgi:hypothetical protein